MSGRPRPLLTRAYPNTPPPRRCARRGVIRVYTDEVHPDTGGFKFGIHRAIWSDLGDRARLRDADGAVVSTLTYGIDQ